MPFENNPMQQMGNELRSLLLNHQNRNGLLKSLHHICPFFAGLI